MTREGQVAYFNNMMNQPIVDDPQETTLKALQHGLKLLMSELNEYVEDSGLKGTFNECCGEVLEKYSKESVERPVDTGIVNSVKQLDDLCDLQFVLSGIINMTGHRKRIDKAFNEVCRSNNSKACETLDEAIKTVEYWENPNTPEGGGEHFYEEKEFDGSIIYIVKRLSDGKVRKSINYSPAELEQFFKKDNE